MFMVDSFMFNMLIVVISLKFDDIRFSMWQSSMRILFQGGININGVYEQVLAFR